MRAFNTLSYEAQHFCQQILMTDPERRMSLVQMRNHPWLNQAYETTSIANSNSACISTDQIPNHSAAAISRSVTVLGTSDMTNRNLSVISETLNEGKAEPHKEKAAAPSDNAPQQPAGVGKPTENDKPPNKLQA